MYRGKLGIRTFLPVRRSRPAVGTYLSGPPLRRSRGRKVCNLFVNWRFWSANLVPTVSVGTHVSSLRVVFDMVLTTVLTVNRSGWYAAPSGVFCNRGG